MNKAVLVGIDKYKRYELVGCGNDVDDFSTFLKKYCNFNWLCIKKRKNIWATKNSIIKALKWLIKDAKPGDNLFFYYSGHGSNVPDLDGDEIDGLDEAICPYNSIKKKTINIENFIIDDEFYKLFQNVSHDVNFIWVSDSCHSGDLYKNLSTNTKKYINVLNYEYIKKIEEKPLSIIQQEESKLEEIKKLNNVIFISACKSDQVAICEYFNNRPNGVFTYHLLDELKKEGSKELSLYSIIQNVKSTLKKSGYQQEPQIYCSDDKINNRFF